MCKQDIEREKKKVLQLAEEVRLPELLLAIFLTLLLLEPKVIGLCYQYEVRPVCAVWPDLTIGWPNFHPDIPKNVQDSSKKNEKLIIPLLEIQ